MHDELRQLEQRRAELSLGGPIAWTIVGGAAALTGGTILLVGLLIESVDSSCEPSSGGYFSDDYCSEPDSTPFLVIGTAGLIVGAVVLAIALPWMLDRIDERRTLGLRIKELRRERAGNRGRFSVSRFRAKPDSTASIRSKPRNREPSPISDGPRLARGAPLLKLRF